MKKTRFYLLFYALLAITLSSCSQLVLVALEQAIECRSDPNCPEGSQTEPAPTSEPTFAPESVPASESAPEPAPEPAPQPAPEPTPQPAPARTPKSFPVLEAPNTESSTTQTNAQVVGDPKEPIKNVRAGDNTEMQVLFELPIGSRVQVIGRSYNADGYLWYKIYSPEKNSQGWIASHLIELD